MSNADELLKQHPHSPASEKVVIGALLIPGQRAQDLFEELTEDDLYEYRNVTIFRAMIAARRKTIHAARDEFKAEMKAVGTWEDGKTPTYFAEAIAAAMHAADVPGHVETVREKATARRMLNLLSEIQGWIIDGVMPIDQIVAHFETDIFKAAAVKQKKELTTAHAAIGEALGELDGRVTGSLPRPVPTGFHEIDTALVGGWRGSQFAVLGARPGLGKTALALALALNAAKAGNASMLFSLEMKSSELGERLVAMESGVPISIVRGSSRPDEATMRKLIGAHDGMSAPLLIDPEPCQTYASIAAATRRAVKRHGVKFVIIDYLQLIEHHGDKGESHTLKVGHTSRNFKLLSRQLDITILALSQLSRESERRGDGRPILSDLRDSGSLEQDADIVMFLWGKDYEGGSEVRPITLCLYKQRSGQTGDIELDYRRPVVRFENRRHY